MKSLFKPACFFLAGWLFSGCSVDEPIPLADDNFGFEQPSHFPDATYTFGNNPVTKKGFELGRKIFYDGILSRDGSVSCSSCHLQAVAFADSPIHPLSVGVDGRIGSRNSPPIQNMAFLTEFFWDGGVTHLDFQPINAIEAPFEMDENITNVIAKFNAHPDYPALFKEAFDADSVTSPYLFYALSQFMCMMVSDQSKYDDYLLGRTQLSTQEDAGRILFENKCAVCHSGVLLTDQGYHNNGLQTSWPDSGRARITEYSGDAGKFRTPSLRNVAKTAPYMHAAHFSTLREVLDFYDSGVQPSATLDTILQRDGYVGIELSETEKDDLEAFLKTLTDFDFLQNPLFSNPD